MQAVETTYNLGAVYSEYRRSAGTALLHDVAGEPMRLTSGEGEELDAMMPSQSWYDHPKLIDGDAVLGDRRVLRFHPPVPHFFGILGSQTAISTTSMENR
jgi:hypothetical protein